MATLSTNAQPKKARVRQLDVLRGLAILLVLLRHPIVDPHESGRLILVAGLIHHLGWTGVDLFFVLSGFLVGGLLFDEVHRLGKLDLRRFIIRRGFKIWPPYLIYIAVVFVILLVTNAAPDGRSALAAIAPNLLHIQNYEGSVRPHTWSLAVEEHFYLALPFLIALLLRRQASPARRITYLPLVAVAVMASCLLYRVLVNLRLPFAEPTHYFATHIRIDSLFFGVLLAYLHQYDVLKLDWVARHRGLVLVFGLVCISPMSYFGLHQPFVWTVGYTLLYLGYGAILLAAISTVVVGGTLGQVLAGRVARVFAWVGYFSYSIYLWHMDIAPVCVRWLLDRCAPGSMGRELRYVAGVALYLPAAVLVGVVMAKIIETPSLALRDRLFPSQARGFSTRSAEPARSDAGVT